MTRVATHSSVRYREGGACASAGAATSAALTACSRKWLDRALNRIITSEPRVSSRPTISAALSPRRGDSRLTLTRAELGAVVISGCTQAFSSVALTPRLSLCGLQIQITLGQIAWFGFILAGADIAALQRELQ